MNNIIYNQHFSFTKVDDIQKIAYQGEDTLPFATNDILLVADGLGGSGGFPHSKINRDIIDCDKFYDLVFKPVFDQEIDDSFKDYILNSFSEIFKTKDYYFYSNRTMRCSGYFASRLASAIALYEIKYVDDFNKDKLFKAIYEARDAEKNLQEPINEYAKKLADAIFEKLQKIASNVGFVMETTVKNSKLLPSTLVIGLVNDSDEREDLDVVYLWAGDSRAYVWDRNGLGIFTEDHEKNETMTNLINLSIPFYLEGKMYTVNKPCILFNASDGCYKCPAFASPFDLEYIILDALKDADTFDMGVENLKNTLNILSTHDDSCTLAISTYGYSLFEDIRSDVLARLKYIDENIIAKLPDILERDYQGELRLIEEEIMSKKADKKRKMLGEGKVIFYLKEKVKSYPPLEKEENELKNKIRTLYNQSEQELEKLVRLITINWIDGAHLRSVAIEKKSSLFVDKEEQINSIISKINNLKDKYEEAIEKDKEYIKEMAKKLLSLLDEVSIFRENSDNVLPKIEEIGKKSNLSGLSSKDSYKSIYKDYSNAKSDLDKKKKKILEEEKAEIRAFAKSILDQEKPYKRSDFGEIADDIKIFVQNEIEIKTRINDIERAIRSLPDKYYSKYYEENASELYQELVDKQMVPDTLINLKILSDDKQAMYEEIKERLEIRNALYEEYRKNYERFMVNKDE